ncbi:FAD-dependent oxidoreductase, partial [Rhizobium ruizarguesonis]
QASRPGADHQHRPRLAGRCEAVAAAERGHRVILAEASSRLGGNFLLAGMQPRRAQILELIGWYERQLTKLGVDIRLNSYVEASDVETIGADAVILATGSYSPETGFQKALPSVATLPGIEKGNVFTVEAVMARQSRPGKRVLLLDEGGGWRGCGTAWKLAEDGHLVTMLSPDPFIGKELQRTTADVPLRRTLKTLGVKWLLEVSVLEWHGNGVTLLDHNTGERFFEEGDSLVLATTNAAANWLGDELRSNDRQVVEIGDCAAPRQAPYAFYEGRRAALEL